MTEPTERRHFWLPGLHVEWGGDKPARISWWPGQWVVIGLALFVWWSA